jgi:protein TonB
VSARRAGREGRTILLAVVGVNGECREVTVAETSGTPSLDEAAMAAVRRWRFTPAMRPDPTAEAIIRVPVIFRLTPL